MTSYELYLFLHLLAVMVWVGATFLMLVLAARVARARDAARTAAYAHDAEWLGLRLYLPSNAVALVSAILLVQEGPWSYDDLWIQLGIAGFTLSLLTGALFFSRQWPRVVAAAAADGADSPAAARRIRPLLVVTGFDLGLLLGIVFEMTVKPTTSDVAALVVTGLLPVAGTVAGALVARGYPAEAPGAAGAAEPGA